MYAVMGLTGQVGSAVANHLLAEGKQVRGIVRSPEEGRGVERARRGIGRVADYNDAAALSAAFSGVDGVFAMIPPYFAPSPDRREVRAVISALHTALHKALPGRVVYLSSIGAQQTSGIGLITALHMLEESMDTLPVPTAALRAGWFMENSRLGCGPGTRTGQAVFVPAAAGPYLCAGGYRGYRPGRSADAAGRLDRDTAALRSLGRAVIPRTTLQPHFLRAWQAY